MKRVVTFLIVKDANSALGFYRDCLGLTFLRDDGFALIFEMNGVMLRIGSMPQFSPTQHTVLGWESDNIEDDIDTLASRGVGFNRYPNLDQDERGVCTFPNGDKVAWFCDPDGNVLSLSQHVPA